LRQQLPFGARRLGGIVVQNDHFVSTRILIARLGELTFALAAAFDDNRRMIRRRFNRRIVVALLVMPIVAIDGWFYFAIAKYPGPMSIFQLYGIVAYSNQLSLLGLWLVFGQTPFVTRLIGFGLSVALLSYGVGGPDAHWLLVFTAVYFVPMFLVAGVMRLVGFQLVHDVDALASAVESNAFRQFSLRQLFGLAIVVAIVLGLGRDATSLTALGVLAVPIVFAPGILPLLLAIAVLSPIRRRFPFCALFAALLTVGISAVAFSGEAIWLNAGMLVAGVSTCVVAAVRFAGYRLARVPYATISRTTLPCTSVSRISRPP
jgi:hypothetical protein